MFEDKDDTILARWLAGELTPEEQEEFENSAEFLEYQQISQGMERFKKPNFNTSALKDKVLRQIENEEPKSKVIRLKPLYYAIGIAASLALIIGIFFNEVSYSTSFGEQLAVDLPDGSTAQLNADSKLTHKRFFWKKNKLVNLKGEAFFKVEKGDGFRVETKSGTVSVLGTAFNVRTRSTNFSLACYEGKVKFETGKPNEEAILEHGDGINLNAEGVIEREKLKESSPSWTQGVSTFTNVVLVEVIQELEAQYGITVQHNLANDNDGFTGSFVHNDLEIALKTVFVPMGITYEVSENQKTILLKTP